MKDNQYTFYWLDGKAEELRGQTPADAMNKAGYGGGALGALDFYEEGKQSYVWKDKKWVKP